MSQDATHELAPDHLPVFIPGADGSDPMFTFVTVFILVLILGIGVFYFSLHALPEKMAHKSNSVQLQLVGVLALLAMFTHNNIYWVIALLLAAVKLPDITGPLNRISESLDKLSKREG